MRQRFLDGDRDLEQRKLSARLDPRTMQRTGAWCSLAPRFLS
jgi:hypothetical protein